jgi:hypothetical protein
MLSLARVLVLIAAVAILALGVLAGVGGILAGLLDAGGEALMSITLGVSLLALGGGLGSALAWQAFQATRNRSSRPFHPQRPWILVLLFPWLLLGGFFVQGWAPGTPLLFAVLHIGAAALPPLAIVALAGQAIRRASRWRDAVLQVSSGAFLSTSLALVAEMVLLILLVVAAIALIARQPGGLGQLQEYLSQLQNPGWLQDPARQGEILAALLRSPLVLAAGFALLVVIVPAIEEAVKAIGVLLFAYRRPTAAQCVSWGLMGGAGFALAEGLLNTTLALDGWFPIVLLRGGTALIHTLAGAIMGLAWYRLLAERRWAPALGLYGASIGVHGLWNGSAALIALLSLATQRGDPGPAAQAFAGLGSALLLASLLAISLAAALGLMLLIRHVRRAPDLEVEAPGGASPLANGLASLPIEPPANPPEAAQD